MLQSSILLLQHPLHPLQRLLNRKSQKGLQIALGYCLFHGQDPAIFRTDAALTCP